MITSKLRLPLLAFIVLSCCILKAESQLAGKLLQNPCVNKATCHECIQTSECAWCSDPKHGDKPRCFLEYTNNFCNPMYIQNPKTVQEILMMRELSRGGGASAAAGGQMSAEGSYYYNASSSSSYSGSYSASSSSSGAYGASGSASSAGEIVQISPQRVNLKLRISKFIFGSYFLITLINHIFCCCCRRSP